MRALETYISQYGHEHTNPWNRVLHALGIPMIFAALVLLPLMHWRLALAFFVGGWVCLFLGHRIEGNKPAFFQGPMYFLVGPVWVAKELKDALLGRPRNPSGLH